MAYSRPKDYGYTQTPAPGGGGGGGAAWSDWTTQSLDPADYDVFGDGAADWTLALVSGKMRATKQSRTPLGWGNTAEQTGIAVINRIHETPWQAGPAPAGFGGEWKTAYAVFRSQVKVLFGSSAAGGEATKIFAGPALVTYDADQVGTPAGPPWSMPIGGAVNWYYAATVAKRDWSAPRTNPPGDYWNATYTGSTASNWIPVGANSNQPAFGSVGTSDQAEISTGSTYAGQFERINMTWQDSRSPTTAPQHVFSVNLDPSLNNTLHLDGKFLYSALIFGDFEWPPGTLGAEVGDYVEITEWRTTVQQLPERGSP